MNRLDTPSILQALDERCFHPDCRLVIEALAELMQGSIHLRIGIIGSEDGIAKLVAGIQTTVKPLGETLKQQIQRAVKFGSGEKTDWMFKMEEGLYDAFVEGLRPILRLLYKNPEFSGVWWEYFIPTWSYVTERQSLPRTQAVAKGIISDWEVHH